MKKLVFVAWIAAAALAGCKKEGKPAGGPAPVAEPTGSAKVDPGSAAGGAGAAGSAAGSATGSAAEPAAPAGPAWKKHTAPEGFTVEAPNEPRGQQTKVPTDIGVMDAQMYMYSTDRDPGAMMVMVTPMPADAAKIANKDPAKFLADSRDGVLKTAPGAKIESETKVKLGDIEGIDVVWGGNHPQMGAFKARMRLFLKGASQYQVQSLRAGDAEAFGKDCDRFIESFAFN